MKKVLLSILTLSLFSTTAAQSALPIPAAEGKTQYPLQLKTPYGTTTIKARPTRVAVVGNINDLEALLALGIVPVISTAPIWPWQDDNGAKRIQYRLDFNGDGTPFEKIAAAKPDVILEMTDYDLKNNYKRLSQIAPVVTMPSYKGDTTNADWQDVIRISGRVFDLSGQAEKRIAEYNKSVAALAARHPEYKGKTVALLINYGPKWGLVLMNYKGSATEDLLTRLGFKPHPHADMTTDGGLKPEQFGQLNADVILLAEFATRPGEKLNSHDWLQQFPLFTSLPAVKKGNLVTIQPTTENKQPIAWALYHPNVLSTKWVLNLLEDNLRVIKK